MKNEGDYIGKSPKAIALVKAVKRQLENVMDPELPFLSISEMGILRDVVFVNDHTICVITPTYSGCPATDVISQDVLAAARTIDPMSEILSR